MNMLRGDTGSLLMALEAKEEFTLADSVLKTPSGELWDLRSFGIAVMWRGTQFPYYGRGSRKSGESSDRANTLLSGIR